MTSGNREMRVRRHKMFAVCFHGRNNALWRGRIYETMARASEQKLSERQKQRRLFCALVYLVSTLGGIIRKAFLVRGFASSLSLSLSLYGAACVHIDCAGVHICRIQRERVAARRLQLLRYWKPGRDSDPDAPAESVFASSIALTLTQRRFGSI